MTVFMETTEISPERTVYEIERALVAHKAQAILKEYGPKGEISAVAFRYRTDQGDVPFRLPCKWAAIAEILRLRAKISAHSWEQTIGGFHSPRRKAIEEKARRVAWRQILRWVEAQLALVDTNMVDVQEVFLPYAQIAAGKSAYDAIKEKGFLQISFEGGK